MTPRPVPVKVPESAQRRLRDLYFKYLQAKHDVALFLEGVFSAANLSMDADWELNIERMELSAQNTNGASNKVVSSATEN